jgi:hypothetical protein
MKIHIIADTFPVKAGKQTGRRRPIKALIVIEDPDLHPAPFQELKMIQGIRQIGACLPDELKTFFLPLQN